MQFLKYSLWFWKGRHPSVFANFELEDILENYRHFGLLCPGACVPAVTWRVNPVGSQGVRTGASIIPQQFGLSSSPARQPSSSPVRSSSALLPRRLRRSSAILPRPSLTHRMSSTVAAKKALVQRLPNEKMGAHAVWVPPAQRHATLLSRAHAKTLPSLSRAHAARALASGACR